MKQSYAGEATYMGMCCYSLWSVCWDTPGTCDTIVASTTTGCMLITVALKMQGYSTPYVHMYMEEEYISDSDVICVVSVLMLCWVPAQP